MIYVMNHYTRDCSKVVSAIESQGFEAKVFTDPTDYYKTKDENRYKGINDNMVSIMEDSLGQEWRLIFHDDMELGRIDSMLHILKYAPPTGVSFYAPQNKGYFAAAEAGHHIMKTNNNLWFPAMAYHDDFIRHFLVWYKLGSLPPGNLSEDRMVVAYAQKFSHYLYAVLPSLTQHAGLDKSTYGNPAKVGRYRRESSMFEPEFDATSVDWEHEFSNPFINSGWLKVY